MTTKYENNLCNMNSLKIDTRKNRIVYASWTDSEESTNSAVYLYELCSKLNFLLKGVSISWFDGQTDSYEEWGIEYPCYKNKREREREREREIER